MKKEDKQFIHTHLYTITVFISGMLSTIIYQQYDTILFLVWTTIFMVYITILHFMGETWIQS